MGRVAFIGDIGGHEEELYAALVGLGADPDTLDLPADLTVVQVGDLVHRGPSSAGVLDIVERMLGTDRWVQLVGNHETNELFPPQFDFERLDDAERDLLRRLFDDGQLHAAAAVRTADGTDVLATHAGLTRGFHLAIGHPCRAQDAAAKLDNLLGTSAGRKLLLRAGFMLETRFPLSSAGPIWAHDGLEVLPGWMAEVAPFDQVHGHTSLYKWGGGSFQAPAEVRAATAVDEERRHTLTTCAGGRRVFGIDPCFGRYAGVRWQPLVIEGRLSYPT